MFEMFFSDTVYVPSRVPSRPIIISIEVMICWATGAGIETA